MAASPQTVDTAPLYLTANTYVYSAKDFRRPYGDILGSGVADYDSFRVRQRAAGANMSVDIQTASVQNRAWVRDSNITDGGLYRVAFNSATQTNLDIAAADPTNPRIDQVYLTVEDSEDTGTNNIAGVRVVTGTATGGATLDNRTGVGAAPTGMSSLLLADVLVAGGATSIANAAIRDRRHFTIEGAGPSPFTGLDQVTFIPAPGLAAASATLIQSTANFDAQQAVALMYLPRRIKGATRIRLKVVQGSTANTANSVIGIYGGNGRLIINSTAAAYGGTANQQTSVSLTIAATDFDQGNYWVFNGNAAGTASGSVTAYGVPGSVATMVSGPNQYAYATSGGTTVPTTILGLTDLWTITGAAVANRPGVPVITLSVG